MPKRYEVKTRTGSVYVIDDLKKTWERIDESVHSGPIRTAGGTFFKRSELTVGEGLKLYGEALTPGAFFRLIYTSDVVRWREL